MSPLSCQAVAQARNNACLRLECHPITEHALHLCVTWPVLGSWLPLRDPVQRSSPGRPSDLLALTVREFPVFRQFSPVLQQCTSPQCCDKFHRRCKSQPGSMGWVVRAAASSAGRAMPKQSWPVDCSQAMPQYILAVTVFRHKFHSYSQVSRCCHFTSSHVLDYMHLTSTLEY